MILAGASIATLSGENGLLSRTREAKIDATKLDIIDQIQTDMIAKQLDVNGDISNVELKTLLTKYVDNPETDIIINSNGTVKAIITKDGHYTINMDEIWSGSVTAQIATDGSWTGIVNSPNIKGTGLTAVYWNGTEWIELNSRSSQEEWSKWYDYSNQNWANAKSADGSMWVWIPRFEYKINSTNRSIDINFIDIGTETTNSYILHPAFDTVLESGGWRTPLPGFWMAKYAAGFQNATVGEETKEIEYSNLKYSIVDSYVRNYIQVFSTTPELSYPVFKANTYAYNIVCVGDVFLLAQEIDTASMYGLSNLDSHLQKNSEWGAAAYLTHSKYGLDANIENGYEVTKNTKNLNNTITVDGSKANVHAVTSYGNQNIPNDTNASSTKNMTGIFDMSGCIRERVAGFFQGGSASTKPAYHTLMATSAVTESTEYLTIYTGDNKKGDAMGETYRWNDNYAIFVNKNAPVIMRGGYFGDDYNWAGIFSYNLTSGLPSRWIWLPSMSY